MLFSPFQGLTSLEFKDKLIVILAGYEADIDTMLQANQGLRSRFSEKVQFPDMTAAAAAELLTKILAGCVNYSR